MRKLLVASQKGGVGKTTTALNLGALAALAGQRVLLVDADPIGSVTASLQLPKDELATEAAANLGLPGYFWPEPLTGLDVFLPYNSEQASEDELALALERVGRVARRRSRDLVLFDAPPSLWQRSRLLLQAAEDLLLVIRAEALAFRTLPGFLEMLRSNESSCRLTGILLTLPAGLDGPSALAEQMLEQLGCRAVPQVIPHDPAVSEALLACVPVIQHQPQSAVAAAYMRVGNWLRLIGPVEEFRRGLQRKRATSVAEAAAAPDLSAILFPNGVPEPAALNGHTQARPRQRLAQEVGLFNPALPWGEQRDSAGGWVREWLPWIALSAGAGVVFSVLTRWILT